MAKRTESLLARLQRIWSSNAKTKPGHERTAEGKEVPTPTAGDFFSNLEKVSKPEK